MTPNRCVLLHIYWKKIFYPGKLMKYKQLKIRNRFLENFFTSTTLSQSDMFRWESNSDYRTKPACYHYTTERKKKSPETKTRKPKKNNHIQISLEESNPRAHVLWETNFSKLTGLPTWGAERSGLEFGRFLIPRRVISLNLHITSNKGWFESPDDSSHHVGWSVSTPLGVFFQKKTVRRDGGSKDRSKK